jgi:hypothetical protein
MDSSSSNTRTSSGPKLRITETLTLISAKAGMIPLMTESRDQGAISAGLGMLGGGNISKKSTGDILTRNTLD